MNDFPDGRYFSVSGMVRAGKGGQTGAYDVPYGPREQISEGVDGFVVPAADIDGAAARVIELLQNPELVTRMEQPGGARRCSMTRSISSPTGPGC